MVLKDINFRSSIVQMINGEGDPKLFVKNP